MKKFLASALLAASLFIGIGPLPIENAHAAASFASGSFLLNTGTGNQAITGVGFQPKLVIFYSGMKADTQGNANQGAFIYGAATSSTKRWCATGNTSWNNVSDQVTGGFSSTKCIALAISTSSAVEVDADFVSMDADGFTINVTTAGTAYRVFYVAFGGSDLSVDVGSSTISGTGNKSYTGIGFQPDIVGFGSVGNGSAAYFAALESSIGWATSSSNQFTLSQQSRDNVNPSDSRKRQVSTTVINNVWITGDEDIDEFVSMDADGFTIHSTTNVNTPIFGWIAIKGCQVKIASFNEPTSTGAASVTTTGFQPSVAMFFSVSAAAGSATVDNWNLMIGSASSGSNYRVFDSADEDNSSPNKGQKQTSEAKVFTHVTGTTTTADATHPTLLADATFTSFDSGGFTYNQTTADATAREVYYVAFAQTAGAAATCYLCDAVVKDAVIKDT